MTDLKSKAVSPTATLELLDADDEPMFDREVRTEEDRAGANRLSITLHGPGSRVFQDAEAEKRNALTDLVMKRNGKAKVTAEERRQLDATFHARITESFNHVKYDGNHVVGFEAFKTVYLDAEVGFIADQVSKFVGDWGNFKKKSPSS